MLRSTISLATSWGTAGRASGGTSKPGVAAVSVRAFAAPSFELVTSWTLDVAVAYVGTWSAVQRYRSLQGRDPLPLLQGLLAPLWGPGERELHWPIQLLLGRT